MASQQSWICRYTNIMVDYFSKCNRLLAEVSHLLWSAYSIVATYRRNADSGKSIVGRMAQHTPLGSPQLR